MKRVFVVTSGDTEKGPNPGLTAAGKRQALVLYDLLPEEPAAICVGEGRRHVETAKELGLWGSRVNVSSIYGSCSSPEIIAGHQMLILWDSTVLPVAQHSSVQDSSPAVIAKFKQLADNTVICGDAQMLTALCQGIGEFMGGSLYCVEVSERNVIHRPQLITPPQ